MLLKAIEANTIQMLRRSDMLWPLHVARTESRNVYFFLLNVDFYGPKRNENFIKMFMYDDIVKNNRSGAYLPVFTMKLVPYPWLQKRGWDGKEGPRMHRSNV